MLHELENRGVFDELVVDDWLHIEQMDERSYWMRIGRDRVYVTFDADGRATSIEYVAFRA